MTATPSFEEVYADHADYVWGLLSRLGVPMGHLDDAMQEVFIAVHRGVLGFEGRSSLKTWVTGISVRVANHFRRPSKAGTGAEPLDVELPDPRPAPDEELDALRRTAVLQKALGQLSDEKREVLVLFELEQMTAPEISAALGVKLNTVYSRVRLAREEFNGIVERMKEVRP